MAVVTTAALKALFETGDPLIEASFESLIDSLIARASSPVYDTVAAMLAEANTAIGSEGAVWRAAQFSYKQAAAAASDHHLTTAGGQKLYVLPDQSGRYNLNAFNVTTATAGLTDAINVVLQKLGANKTLYIPAGNYLLTRATAGTVNAGSSTLYDGVISAIYLDSDGQQLVGDGYATHLNGQNAALNVIHVRSSHCRVAHLRAGNCAGQLSTNESAGVAFTPSNFVQGSGTGSDITDLRVHDCDLYDCDSGVTGVTEWDNLGANKQIHLPSGLSVTGCRIIYRRQGIECFQCNDTQVKDNDFTGLDKGAYAISRMVRNIGSYRTVITGNRGLGFSVVGGYYGVECSMSGWYGTPALYDETYDCIISDNVFRRFNTPVFLGSSRGGVQVAGNLFDSLVGVATDSISGVRVSTVGLQEVGGDATLANKYSLDRLHVSDNQILGYSVALQVDGRAGVVRFLNNFCVANGNTAGKAVNITMVTSADPTINAMESIGLFEAFGNTSLAKTGATGGDYNLTNLKPGDEVIIGENRMSRPANQLVSETGTQGNVRIPSPTSNITLAGGQWERDFNPPRGFKWDGNDI